MASPPIELIIFDCDGVLVDSEPLAMRVLLKAIAEAGIEIDAESGFREFLGRSLATVTARLEETHGLRLDAAALERMRRELYETFRRELKPHGVGVSLVEPGRIATPIWDKSMEDGMARLDAGGRIAAVRPGRGRARASRGQAATAR